jgi:hypothetical protein
MAYLVKQASKTDYHYAEYYLDSADELSEINVNSCCPGSVAYIMTTGDVYMLTNKKEWKLQ